MDIDGERPDHADEVIQDFMAVTGSQEHVAESYLGAHGWDLNTVSPREPTALTALTCLAGAAASLPHAPSPFKQAVRFGSSRDPILSSAWSPPYF